MYHGFSYTTGALTENAFLFLVIVMYDQKMEVKPLYL